MNKRSLLKRLVRTASVSGLSSALTSFVVHVAVLILLALLYLPQAPRDSHKPLIAINESQQTEFELETLQFESAEVPTTTMFTSASVEAATTTQIPEIELASLESPTVSGTAVLAPETTPIDLLAPVATKPKRDHETYFFGIPAKGQRFVYILDMSTSMRERNAYGFSRFHVAARELIRTVEALDEEQEFLVVAFCYQSYFFTPNPAQPKMTRATAPNKQRLQSWVSHLQLASGTDPRQGVVAALRLKPDAIFLLSDGEFNGRKKNRQQIPGNVTTEQLIVFNRRADTPIHTIALDGDESRVRLAAIAKATGGKHRFVEN